MNNKIFFKFFSIFLDVNQNIQVFGEFVENDDYFFEILSPESLSYTYKISKARGFGGNFSRRYSRVSLVPANPIDMCSSAVNSYSLRNSVALVRRGECTFQTKSYYAEKAGAIATIITDHNADNDDAYLKMIDDGSTEKVVNIPAFFMLGINGHRIISELNRLNEQAAIINIPVNKSFVPPSKINQPKWHVW